MRRNCESEAPMRASTWRRAAAGRRVSVVWRDCPFIHKRRSIHAPAAPMNGSERDGNTIPAVPGRAVVASASPRPTCEIDRRDVLFPPTEPVNTIRDDMQMLTTLLLVWVLGGVRGAMRTPLEAFRPSEEVRVRRPDKLPLMVRRWNGLPTKGGLKIFYQTGSSEEELPACRPHQVCSKVDLYDPGQPWIERKCRCIGHRPCSSNLSPDDNHSLSDKTTLYKTCEPIKRLPKCRYFKDAAWTLFSLPDSNATQQIVNCHCPKLSVTYLLKKLPYTTPSGQYGNQYQFACSPQSRLRCSRKEPCKLFSVRRRHELIDEVNASAVCQCPRDHSCPRRHDEPGVLAGLTYTAEDIRTYHGYCVPEIPTERRFVGDKD